MAELIEFDYYISPAPESQEFNLHDAHVRFVMSITGRGMPPIQYITERGPLQHGESLLDYRLRPRMITMITRRRFQCREDYWDGRNALLDALRPNRQAIGQFNPGVLRKVLPDGSMRDIEVMIESGPAFEPRDTDRWDERAFTEILRFVAHDPTFYDPDQQAEQWTVTLEDNLIFYEAPAYIDRLVFPIWFEGPIISAYQDVAYLGTWVGYPTIVVTGPASNLLIRNITTDERLDLSAYSIGVGEIVTFTTEYGNKTVTNQIGDNLLPYLSTDSDLATFHLEPDPGAAGGVNQMYVSASGVTPATQVVIYWFIRYIGI